MESWATFHATLHGVMAARPEHGVQVYGMHVQRWMYSVTLPVSLGKICQEHVLIEVQPGIGGLVHVGHLVGILGHCPCCC